MTWSLPHLSRITELWVQVDDTPVPKGLLPSSVRDSACSQLPTVEFKSMVNDLVAKISCNFFLQFFNFFRLKFNHFVGLQINNVIMVL